MYFHGYVTPETIHAGCSCLEEHLHAPQGLMILLSEYLGCGIGLHASPLGVIKSQDPEWAPSLPYREAKTSPAAAWAHLKRLVMGQATRVSIYLQLVHRDVVFVAHYKSNLGKNLTLQSHSAGRSW